MTPLHQNSQTSLGPWKQVFSRPGTWWRGPWSRLTYSTIWLFCWANPEIFSLFCAMYQTLFNFYCQTDRHILHPYMHGQDFFSIWKFILFTTLCSFIVLLTRSLCLWRRTDDLMCSFYCFGNCSFRYFNWLFCGHCDWYSACCLKGLLSTLVLHTRSR